MTTDIELLRAEVRTLWHRDARERLVRENEADGRVAPHVVVGVAAEGVALAFGSAVPDALATDLRRLIPDAPGVEPASPPVGFAACEVRLAELLGPVVRSSGPSYLVVPGTAYRSAAGIRRWHDGETADLGESAPPLANWPAGEWRDLLAGSLGPWAMAMVGDRIVAICHSARLAPEGAEAGVWTDPEYRGHGHAAAVTAAWAALVESTGRRCFYSTSADNHASQRVAAKLGLRPLGWLWKLSPVTA